MEDEAINLKAETKIDPNVNKQAEPSEDRKDTILETNDHETENKDIKIEIYPDTGIKDSLSNLNTDYDAYVGEDNKLFKRYKLREASKQKHKTLNEDVLLKIPEKRKNTGSKKSSIIEKKKENNVKMHECKICLQEFESMHLLGIHKLTHPEKKIFKCSKCNEEFSKNTELLDHKKIHVNEENIYSCKKCRQAFSTEVIYFTHMINHMKPPFKCHECLFTTKNSKRLKAHILQHYDEKVKCEICNETVNSRRLKEHTMKHNTKLECGECGKICTTQGYLDYHMTSHTGVKLIQCLYCGKGFANNQQRLTHTKIHTGNYKMLECNICFRKLKDAASFLRHSFIHKGKSFECHDCGKKFIHKESLKYHMKYHSDFKAYKCPSCPRRFVTSSHLTIHIRGQHMEWSYNCDVCDRKFASASHFDRHKASKKHRNNMYAHTKGEK